MSKIIVANWKMHPDTLDEAEDLYRISSGVIVCPPFVYLEALSKISSGVMLGAQDCHFEDEGAWTGEVSAKMLKNLGVKYVIIGHSERRWKMNETDGTINKKIKAVLRNEMTPILAVGEKEKGDDREKILTNQLNVALEGVESREVMIAYEPVWSISTVTTGELETPEHALEDFEIIRKILNNIAGEENLNIPILYGGSVDSQNIGGFISKPEIAGVLVGGASVDNEEFRKIIEKVSNLQL